MIATANPVLVLGALLSTCVWIGGLTTIAVVVRVTGRELDAAARVDFFRDLGRTYLRVGAPALVVMLASGAGLLASRPWDGGSTAALAVGVALVLVTAAGVAQARAMTRLRARVVAHPEDAALAERVTARARRAALLRAAIGALSLALVVFAAFLTT